MQNIDTFTSFCPSQNGFDFGNLLFAQTVQLLAAAQCALVNPNDWPKDYANSLNDNDEFDFIIIGAGTSGSIIANRLSEVQSWRILLVEAGGDDNTIESQVPVFYSKTLNSSLDWKFKTDSQTNACLSSEEQRCVLTQGKSLGGTSAINELFYQPGENEDYDRWKEMGNLEWGYDDLKEYFKDFKTNDGISDNYSDLILKAFEEIGVPIISDGKIGSARVKTIISDGRRLSMSSYLKSAKNRTNLFIAKNTKAEKILYDTNRDEVIGISLRQHGRVIAAKASKEIIVAAGAVNSAQLLMLSGIGPKDHLDDIAIKTIADLPVGNHLKDHLFTPAWFTFDDTYETNVANDWAEYLIKKTGRLSNIGTWNIVGRVNLNNNQSFPNIQIHTAVFSKNDHDFPYLMYKLGYNEDIVKQSTEIISDKGVIFVYAFNLYPESEGTVLLKTKYARNYPNIDPNYLHSPKDEEVQLNLLNFLKKLESTVVFNDVNATLYEIELPECEMKEYWSCYMKHMSASMSHLAGTVRMAAFNDETGVVDNRLQVNKVNGIRVADASIMPELVGGSILATVMVIGEKASDMIKQDWIL